MVLSPDTSTPSTNGVKDSLAHAITDLSEKVESGQGSHWHVSVAAPRWALRSAGRDTALALVAGIASAILAVLGFALAFHAINDLSHTQSALAVQIGPWAVAAILLTAAAVIGYVAFNSRRLHLDITQVTGDDAGKALVAGVTGAANAGVSNGSGSANHDGVATMQAAGAALQAAAQLTAAGHPDASAVTATAVAAADQAGAAAANNDESNGNAQDPGAVISPKVWSGTAAGAAAFSFWTIAAATFWKGTFSAEALAALVGSTTTIVSAAAAYLKRDPLRNG